MFINIRLTGICCVLLAFLTGVKPKQEPTPKPNIIFILADDLGWADLGCYGNMFNETPALDSLAKAGIHFTQAYATCPVCSPSRASIMTGKTPIATGITDWIPGRKQVTGTKPNDGLIGADTKQFLDLQETTLAEVLKANGYATALFGKWHLGNETYFPEKQGFDLAVGKPHSGTPLSYFFPYQNKNNTSEDLNLEGKQGEYLTDRLTDETIRFMEQNKNRPFFAYLAHHAVHTPIHAKAELIEKYQKKLNGRPENAPENPRYAALLESLDQSVGKIVKYLKTSGLDKNTILIFTSDNGGLSVEEGQFTPATSNAPLREGKGHVYEGGIRVPLLMYVPNTQPHQENMPIWGADFYPTLLAMAGIAMPNPREIEGLNLKKEILATSKKARERTLYWHYPHYSNQKSKPAAAIRVGDWKLVQHFENKQLELYDLSNDIGEKQNLSTKYPKKAQKLLKKLEEWQQKHNAILPMPK